jgi:hypothetical protein
MFDHAQNSFGAIDSAFADRFQYTGSIRSTAARSRAVLWQANGESHYLTPLAKRSISNVTHVTR